MKKMGNPSSTELSAGAVALQQSQQLHDSFEVMFAVHMLRKINLPGKTHLYTNKYSSYRISAIIINIYLVEIIKGSAILVEYKDRFISLEILQIL